MSKAGGSIEDLFPRWYDQNARLYEDLSKSVAVSLDSLLKSAKIEYVSVSSRLKSKDSCSQKLTRKPYQSPEEMTDVAALRVIAYLQSDVEKICDLIVKEFEVRNELTVDKDHDLGTNKVGYRSKHFVCRLGKNRLRLKENLRFSGLSFEVQVRTVLQHAWAEIEHDKNYKFAGTLPRDLKRRLNLVAGMLEIADLEFEDITRLIADYQRRVSSLASKGDLTVEVNSLSVTEYLAKKKFFDGKVILKEGRNLGVRSQVIDELSAFGISTLAQLEAVLKDEFVDISKQHGGVTTPNGFLRRAMMFADPEKFFGKAQPRDFQAVKESTMKMLEHKVGKDRARKLVAGAGLRLSKDS